MGEYAYVWIGGLDRWMDAVDGWTFDMGDHSLASHHLDSEEAEAWAKAAIEAEDMDEDSDDEAPAASS